MKMKRLGRLMVSVLLGTVMILAFAGCGQPNSTVTNDAVDDTGSDTGSSTEEKVTIRFAFWGIPEEVAVQEEIEAAFEASHPNIDVVLEHVSDAGAFPAAVLTQIAGGNAPDVFYLGEAVVNSFAEKGVLMDQLPLAEASGYDFDDVWEGVKDPMGYNEGHMWAFPKDTTPYMMYYNKDLFDAAGVEYPTADWTWDDFVAKAKALTVKDGDEFLQYGFAPDTWWGPWITSIYKNGGRILTDDGKINMNTPETIEALKWYSGLMSGPDAISPDAEALAGLGQSMTDLFNSEAAAMVSGGRWVSYFTELDTSKWGVVPFPNNGDTSSPLLFVALCMPSSGQHPEEAWEFIQFYVGQEGQRINSATGLGMPILKSVTEEGTWLLEGESESNIDIFLEQFNNTASLPFHEYWQKTIDEIAQGQITDLFYGTITVEEAVQTIDEEANKVIEQ